MGVFFHLRNLYTLFILPQHSLGMINNAITTTTTHTRHYRFQHHLGGYS